jgi:hypothetical protein
MFGPCRTRHPYLHGRRGFVQGEFPVSIIITLGDLLQDGRKDTEISERKVAREEEGKEG